ncbi:MAG: hypothetical protein WC839_02945 [Candidatus Paceibacterota bacterium]
MKKSKLNKTIKERIERFCVICGKKIKVILYNNRSYRGGHYFKFGDKRPKDPQKEYWECPKCYRGL